MRDKKTRSLLEIFPPIIYLFFGIAIIILALYFWATEERRREHKIQKMLLDLPNVTDVTFSLYEGKSLAKIQTNNGNELVFVRIDENSFISPETLFLSEMNSYQINCLNHSNNDDFVFLNLKRLGDVFPLHRSYVNLNDVLKQEQDLVNWIESTIPIQERNKLFFSVNTSICIRSY